MVPIDTAAESIATADFNHDGNADVAVASYDAEATVSVFLGTGDGSFQRITRYPVGSGPYGVAAGDVNEDGNQDIVVGNYNDDTISVLLGKGDGTFAPQTVVPATDVIVGVALGDVNNDGHLDIISASEGAAVFLGNGDGTFGPPMMATSLYVLSVVLGDFDRDGNLDIGVGYIFGSGGEGYVQILKGNGDGSFVAGSKYSLAVSDPYTLAAGDVNHDGKLDVVATTFFLGIYVLIGDGDGTFAAPALYGTRGSTYGVVIADFNRDGDLDLAVGDYSDPSFVSVLTGKGDGTFRAAINYNDEGNGAVGVVAPDLNNDGSPDLVVANSNKSYQMSVFLNTGGTLLRSKSSPNPSKVGQKVTFSAQVKASVPNTGSPTGTVTFQDGAKSAKVNLVNGSATFSTSTLTPGTHTITVSYSGDKNFNPNNAKPLVQVVNP
ncbi:MAG: VCBS repeat-containing protein [Acidobacteriales bacterium]|nr:VCBS repeat-containing protein [Terriglobales bacterium]